MAANQLPTADTCHERLCEWPMCQCDPTANRVAASLIDQGWRPPLRKPLPKTVHDYLAQRYGHHYADVLSNEVIAIASDLFEQFHPVAAKVANG